MQPQLVAAKLTDVGRARDHQEDCAGWFVPEDGELRRRKGMLAVVADGMGGHNAGEVASQWAVEEITRDHYHSSLDDVPASLVQAIKNANRMILQQAQSSPALAGMGTTAVVAVVRGRELHIANVGDSRAYLLRNGQIRQITVDHSWVAERLAAGVLTEAEARVHPERGVVTRALGSQADVEVDTFQGEIREGDVLVLCSDGLTGHVADAEILSVAGQFPPEEAAQRLVNRANELGGSDNISLVVIRALRAGEVWPPPRQFRRSQAPLIMAGVSALALAAVLLGLFFSILNSRRVWTVPTRPAILSPTATTTPTATDTVPTPPRPTSTLIPTWTPSRAPTSTPARRPTVTRAPASPEWRPTSTLAPAKPAKPATPPAAPPPERSSTPTPIAI